MLRSGTIALWYTTRGSGRELRPKSEAPYVDSKPHGVKRSWYRSGKPELEARYERGSLQGVKAWTEAGLPLGEAEARALAARELSGDEALYAAARRAGPGPPAALRLTPPAGAHRRS